MLKIAKNASLTDIVSNDDSNPISTDHPITGSSETMRLYLFNDESDRRYTDVRIEATEPSWVQVSKDGTNFSDAIAFDELDQSAISFHVRITTPVLEDVMNRTDIKLRKSGRRRAK